MYKSKKWICEYIIDNKAILVVKVHILEMMEKLVFVHNIVFYQVAFKNIHWPCIENIETIELQINGKSTLIF
jgi:hypothetical protein